MKRSKPVPEYVIAVPSYDRAALLQKATLRVLEKHGIDPSRVYIFVANEEELAKYKSELPPMWKKRLVVAVLGMKNVRIFMSEFFPEGQCIVYMDDDVHEIWDTWWDKDKFAAKPAGSVRMAGNTLVPLVNLDFFINTAFEECRTRGRRLFGVNAVKNPFFCKAPNDPEQNSAIRDGLYFAVGTFYGCINDRNACGITAEVKTDYELTLRYYLLDGGVLRIPSVTISTEFYTTPGGMQKERTWERSVQWTRWIASTYKDLSTVNDTRKKRTDKTTGKPFLEMRLWDKRKEKKFGVDQLAAMCSGSSPSGATLSPSTSLAPSKRRRINE